MVTAAMMATVGATLLAQPAPPLQAARIVEHVGTPLPRDLTFSDADGRRVSLGSLIGSRPLVISLAYFTCPMLCHLGQDGAADAFRDSGWHLGDDFEAVTVSIDPRDRSEAALAWRRRAAQRLHRPEDGLGWRFLIGDPTSIAALADALGFEYAYDEASGQYSHAAALYVIATDGRIARYLYGIDYEPSALAAALEAARQNQLGGPVDRLLLRCYHYVPSLRRHGGFVAWLLRLGGLSVTLSIASLLIMLWRRERRATGLAQDLGR